MENKVLGHLPFVVLAILTIAMAAFSFIGEPGDATLYSNPLMILGWVIVVALAGLLLLKKRKTLGIATLLIHVSFVVILIGALFSHFSETGVVHLREGEEINYAVKDNSSVMRLPFSITLQKFEIEYYHGTDAPKDFVSIVETHVHASNGDIESENIHRISMNNVLDIAGYRLFQSSYDDDLKGSLITVAHDPIGTTITYVGYVMLAISMIIFVFGKRSHFHQILKNPLWKSFAVVAILLMPTLAGSTEYYSIAQDSGADFAKIPIIYNGRIAPMETYALDFTRKLTGGDSFGEFDATQVLAGWIYAPQDWRKAKMIKSEFGMIDFDSAIDSLNRGVKAKLMTKEFDELDEKIGLILDLQSGDAIKYAPSDVDYPEWRFKVEHLYNKYCKTAPLAYASLALGLLSFFCLLRCKLTKFRIGFVIASAVIFIGIATIMGMRGIIAGRFPMSNGYETMLFISWLAFAMTTIAGIKLSLVLPAGFFIGGFALLVSKMGMMNPEITPLAPVLASPWMSIHVTLMMLSYTLYAFMAFNSLASLVFSNNIAEAEGNMILRLALLNRFMLYPATFLLTIGMFIGAVWANESWGSYWSWDPKETWALITMIIYAMAFHRESISWMKNDKAFQIYILVSFAAIIMTYFGVNYLLGGMHSYAG